MELIFDSEEDGIEIYYSEKEGYILIKKWDKSIKYNKVSNSDYIKNLSVNWDKKYEGDEYTVYIQQNAYNSDTGFIRMVNNIYLHRKSSPILGIFSDYKKLVYTDFSDKHALYFQKE